MSQSSLPAPEKPARKSKLPSPTPVRDDESAIIRWLNGLVIGIARHWLLLINLAVAVYLFLPVLAPILMHAGYTTPAHIIYSMYSFACHQLPDRSYFLFGDQPMYDVSTLVSNGMNTGLGLLERRRFIGNEIVGYKLAFCQRDLAIYGSVLLAGLVYGLLRNRIRPLSLKVYALFLIPIALDGTTQLVGLRTSNWWLRLITGALFGAASVWLAYPHLESAMKDAIRTELARTELTRRKPPKPSTGSRS